MQQQQSLYYEHATFIRNFVYDILIKSLTLTGFCKKVNQGGFVVFPTTTTLNHNRIRRRFANNYIN